MRNHRPASSVCLAVVLAACAGALAGAVCISDAGADANVVAAPAVDIAPGAADKAPAPQVPVKPDPAAWTLSRGDSAQTGVAAGTLPDKLALKWRFKTEAAIKAAPIIADGKAFIGSTDGSFYAIDLKTGKKAWSFSTIDGPLHKDASPNEKKFADAIEASACYVDGRVYVGAHDGNFYCLDAKTGKMLWHFETMDKITAAANWTKSPDGKATWILVGSNDARMYCLDAATGKKVWEYETGNIINGAPAISAGPKGVTVFGGCDGLVHVVSIADGAKAGEVEIQDYIAASAALGDGRVYVGHHGNKFICVDLKAKKIAWQYGQREFPFMAAPALTKDAVIFGGHDRRVHCVDREKGEMKWQFRARGQFNSAPVVTGKRVVLGCDDGRVYMLNLADGTEVWQYEIGQPVTGSPAVVDGMMVIGADDGFVYAFGEDSK